MAETDRLDDRGRITIRRGYRERLGEKVVQILTPHGVLLRPVAGELRYRGRLPKDLSAIRGDVLYHEGEEAA